MTERRGSRVQEAFASIFGGLAAAEVAPREARSLGLMAAGPNGRNRIWKAADIAAIIAAHMLVSRPGARFRDAGRRRLLDPDLGRETIDGIVTALRYGQALEFNVGDGGPVTETVRMSADGVERLARLVDDWGDAEAAE